MKTNIKAIIFFALAMGLPLLACESVRFLSPAITPTVTPTFTQRPTFTPVPPTATPTPTPTSTPTPTLTPTPMPIPPAISGNVTSADHHAANRQFTLCKIVTGGCQFTSLMASSNADEHFEFRDVPPGDYYIFYDSGYENFGDAVKKWGGKIIQVGNVQWLADNFVTHNSDGTISFTLISGMKLDKNAIYMAIYRFFAKSPFLWAHTCGPQDCSSPEDVSPVIAKVADGMPMQVEFEVYGPIGDLSGAATPGPNLTSIPTPGGSAVTVFSADFNGPTFDGSFDSGQWTYQAAFSDISIHQMNGAMVLSKPSISGMESGSLKTNQTWSLGEVSYIEARLKLDQKYTGEMGNVGFSFGDVGCSVQIQGKNTTPFIWCAQSHIDSSQQWVADYMSDSYYIDYNQWYTARIEFSSQTHEFTSYIDGKPFYSWQPTNIDELLKGKSPISLNVWADNGTAITGYVDDVRLVK